MHKLSIIPDRNEISQSLRLSKAYGTQFEYNDFFIPTVLADKEQRQEIEDFYLSLNRGTALHDDTIHGAFLDTVINSEDPQIREISRLRFHQSMEAAERMGLRAVIIHTNYIVNFNLKQYRQSWVEEHESYIQELLLEFPEQQIYMENMFDLDPVLLGALAEKLKDEQRFGVCFDVAHANISSTPLKEWFDCLSPYICHIHLNDNNGIADLHQPVGQGSIDWENYDHLVREHRIDATVLVENTGYQKQEASLVYMKEHHIYPFE